MSGNAKRPERDHAEARSAIRDRRFDDAIGLLEQSLIGGPDDVDAAGGKIRRIDKKLAAFLGRSPDTATAEELRAFQQHLAASLANPLSINITVSALRFFFRMTIDKPETIRHLVHVYEPQKLPRVLSPEEVLRLLEAATTPRDKAVLSVAYGTGLRAKEVVTPKISDIDSKSMLIRVENGKGGKDRFAMLSPTLLEVLLVSYFHVVFTLPAQVADIAYHNKRVIYALLFKASAQAMQTIAADPRPLGAKIAITSVLHTWGSAMTHHPQVHMIVPGGGLLYPSSYSLQDYYDEPEISHLAIRSFVRLVLTRNSPEHCVQQKRLPDHQSNLQQLGRNRGPFAFRNSRACDRSSRKGKGRRPFVQEVPSGERLHAAGYAT